jgi:hypothetical protein
MRTRKGGIAGAIATLEVESRRRVAMTAGMSSLMLSEHLAQRYRRVDRVDDAVALERELSTLLAVADHDHPIKRRLQERVRRDGRGPSR